VGQTQSPYALSHRCVACQYEVSKICRLSLARSNHKPRYRCSSAMGNPSVPMSCWLSTATILKSGSNDGRTARSRASFHRTILRKKLMMMSRSESRGRVERCEQNHWRACLSACCVLITRIFLRLQRPPEVKKIPLAPQIGQLPTKIRWGLMQKPL